MGLNEQSAGFPVWYSLPRTVLVDGATEFEELIEADVCIGTQLHNWEYAKFQG